MPTPPIGRFRGSQAIQARQGLSPAGAQAARRADDRYFYFHDVAQHN